MRRECEGYVAELCRKYDIRRPFLFFDDRLQNPGACGEAGQSTIWVKRDYFLRVDRCERERVIRHELAHISVHNTPGWDNAPAHGAEFAAELTRLTC